jgi:hypothetical protein
MTEPMYHRTTPEIAAWRKQLAPQIHDAFEAFSHASSRTAHYRRRTKQLIAVAVAHTTQCPLLHPGTHPARPPQGSQPGGDHGSGLGGGRDARRERLSTLDPRAPRAR